ncbi:Txe/YoeB family addiction module toxin [Bacteroidia bacterium]|nr:Txe/YoeB family addiction module toxin [Bacteroidia bacterium]GHT47860.1 Txe/YoeB family addiction module toxin [Bacteroidia bacterium]
MDIVFSPEAEEDFNYWRSNAAIVDRIKRLLKDIAEHPYTGIGKPERLKWDLSGKWSRRITAEHRVIYIVRNEYDDVYVLALRYHYSK